MNLYDATIPQFTTMLRNVERWLDKAVAFAEQKKFDPETLLTARLAPDQYPLLRQIQAACDSAKFAAAKLTGKEPPSDPDVETNLAEIRERIHTCIAYLETFTREDFEGAEERRCIHVWMGEKWLRGGDYLDWLVLPNFHFHATTAYAILRHNGVDLGKTDFITHLPFQE
jgi:hypothetical protein